MILDQFPRHPLTFGPSPLQHLKRLTQHLGGAEIWAKREDVSSGLAFGGNKTRKLEYIVPDVLASGADTIVSIGGYQSNHTRQVAAVAAHLGLKARLVQEKWVPWDEPVNDKVGNILLSRMMGADSRLDDAGFDIGIRDSWKQALQEVEDAGGTPYPIPAGASEHRLGGLGFANWAFEVAEQEKQLGVFFDTIIVCTMTGLVIMVSGVWSSGESGAALSSSAFETALPGFGAYFLAAALAVFAYTTILGWAYYGEKCWEYLVGSAVEMPYRILWTIFVLIGTITQLEFVWLVADTLNAFMAFPNLVSLLLLSPVIVKVTQDYFASAGADL